MRKDLNFWTDEELEILRRRWPTDFATDISDEIRRSPESINHKAKAMGLVKDPSFNRHGNYGAYTKKGNHFNTNVNN